MMIFFCGVMGAAMKVRLVIVLRVCHSEEDMEVERVLELLVYSYRMGEEISYQLPVDGGTWDDPYLLDLYNC